MSGIDFSGLLKGQDQDELAKEAGGGFTLLPPGWHVGHIISVDMKENKKKTGSYLQIDLEKADGAKVTDRLNLIHTSEQTQNIAKAQLASLANAIDLDLNKSTSDDMLGREVGFKVAINSFTSNKDGKELQNNEVKAYRAADKGEQVDVQAETAPHPAKDGNAPW